MSLDRPSLMIQLLVTALTLVLDICLVPVGEFGQPGLVSALDMRLETTQTEAVEHALSTGEGISIKPLLIIYIQSLMNKFFSYKLFT